MATQLFDPSTMQAGNNLAKAIDNVVKNRFAQEELDEKVRIEGQKFKQQENQNARMFQVAERGREESREDANRIFNETVRQGEAAHDNRLLEGNVQLEQNKLVLENQKKNYLELLQQGKDARKRGDEQKTRDINIKLAELGVIIQKGDRNEAEATAAEITRINNYNAQIKANQDLVKYIGKPFEGDFIKQKLHEGFQALNIKNNEIVAGIFAPGETIDNATKVLNMMLNVLNGVQSQTALKGYETWSLENDMPNVMAEARNAGINSKQINIRLESLMERVKKAFIDKEANLALAIEGSKRLATPEGFLKAIEGMVNKESNPGLYK